jgi:hypothetical protein
MAGGISWETLYANLQAGEVARPGVTAEEEKALIMAEMGSPRFSGSADAPPDSSGILESGSQASPVMTDVPDMQAQLDKALAPLFEALNRTQAASDRVAALESSVNALRQLVESGAGPDVEDALRSLEARLQELMRTMIGDAIARQPQQQAPVVNATIVLPADPKTPLVRTVERNAEGLITKITDKPAESQ